MNINRHNYESFFLLYVDHELDAAGKEAVEAFVRQNPDLERELQLLQQSVFPPDQKVVFSGKAGLLKEAGQPPLVHAGNYESFFVMYADDELDTPAKAAVESFVYHHPQYQAELELLQAIRMTPDTSVVYERKQSLYRHEEKDGRVVVFTWWRFAAAALLLLLLGIWWLNREQPARPAVAAAEGQTSTKKETAVPHTDTPATLAKAGTGTRSTGIHPAPADKATGSRHTKNANSVQPPVLVAKTPVQQKPGTTLPANDGQTAYANNPVIDEPVALSGKPLQTTHIARVAVPANPVVRIEQPALAIANNNYTEDNDSDKDQLEVGNLAVDKRTALRGLLRKASRFLTKKTGTADDDSDQKHILIGSFAIAVK